jgi:hypothetical protein
VPAFDASSTNNQVTAFVNRPGTVPMRVTYTLVNNADGTRRLTRTTTPGVGAAPPFSWPAAGATTQVLANRLSQGTVLLFTYFDAAGAADPPCSTGATPCATPMNASPTLSAPGSVGAVGIVLRAQSGPAAPPTELSTRVRVANAGLVAIV